MQKVYFIRHGESVDDIEDRFGGFANYPLTTTGETQAQALAAKLAHTGIQTLMSSPYLRAWQTAVILADNCQVTLELNQNLRERNTYGYLSGMRKAEAAKFFPTDVANTQDSYLADRIDGTETVEDVLSRAKTFHSQLQARPEDIVGVISHGKFLDIYLGLVAKVGKKYKFKECGYVLFAAQGDMLTEIQRENVELV